jgi:NAD(P)-dependent dehydrogenase (short-subunit alcohol dehydrogenase family)
VSCDVAIDDDLNTAMEHYGRIDVLVNNAAPWPAAGSTRSARRRRMVGVHLGADPADAIALLHMRRETARSSTCHRSQAAGHAVLRHLLPVSRARGFSEAPAAKQAAPAHPRRPSAGGTATDMIENAEFDTSA